MGLFSSDEEKIQKYLKLATENGEDKDSGPGKYLTKAAELGSEEAQLLLAKKRVIQWTEHLANKGNLEAILLLATDSDRRFDSNMAIYWYEKAHIIEPNLQYVALRLALLYFIDDKFDKVFELAEGGNEWAETIISGSYLYLESDLQGLAPLMRQAYMRYFREAFHSVWIENALDVKSARVTAEKVALRFISRINEYKGKSLEKIYFKSDFIRKFYIKTSYEVEDIYWHELGRCRNIDAYTPELRIQDESAIVWELGLLYFKEKNFRMAGYLLTSAVDIALMFYDNNSDQQMFGKPDYCHISDEDIAIAQYGCGLCLEEGDGVEQDYGEAIYFYELAAKAGNADAQAALGILLYQGLGVQKNEVGGRAWILKAAEQNSPRAVEFISEHPKIRENGVNNVTNYYAEGDIYHDVGVVATGDAIVNRPVIGNMGESKFCIHCGTSLPEDARFCFKCGKETV